MNSLRRRLLDQRAAPRHRLLAPLARYATQAKPKPKSPSTAAAAADSGTADSPASAPPRSGYRFRLSPNPSESPLQPGSALSATEAKWARPSEVPFQAKVANSVHLIGYVHAPVQFQTTPDGSSWAATVLTQNNSYDSCDDDQSPDSLPLWVPIIFEGDLAHIAVSHLKENDHVYIAGQLSASLPHVNDSQVQASVQVMVHDISFVEQGYQKKKFSNVFIESERETSNRSDSLSKYEDSVLNSWRDLLDNPKEWWDNRAGKLNGSLSRKYPDFKRKDGSNVLWLNKAPQLVLRKLEGLEFDVQIQRPKEVKQSIDSRASALNSWTDVIDNPQEWCDYRISKLKGLVNPNYPDFKRRDGSSALWLDRAPQWLLPKLEGLEFHVETQKSKVIKDGKGDDPWKDLVENPDRWWDNRLNKIKERAPDYKHKETGQVLWLSDAPTWVSSKLPPPKSKGDVAKGERDTLLS